MIDVLIQTFNEELNLPTTLASVKGWVNNVFVVDSGSTQSEACAAMSDAITKAGSFFQMGFMRRFDPGYAAAKEKIAQGAIGRPLVFKSILNSRSE